MMPIRYFRFVYLLIAALALGTAGAIAQTADGLSPLQVAQIETVTSVAISPDGRHVAFTRIVPGDPFQENVAGTPYLYVVDTQTGTVTGLHTVSSAAGVAFRPEHGTITFLASIEDREPRALYEVPVTGGSPVRLVAHERAILGYEWNPDGNRVAFESFERVDAPVTPLPYRPTFYEENLAQRMAYIHDVRSNSEARPVDYVGSYYTLAWSPSGERLAVAVAPTPMVDDMYMFQEVKVVDPRTGVVVAEIDNAGKIDQITWSPDERQLALRAGDHMNDPIAGRIMIVSADGGTPRNILPNFEGKFEQIAWTGAGTIHFIASQSTEKAFGTIAPDGSGFTTIAAVDALNLLSFDRAGDGTIAFVANTPQHPSEVYFLRAGAEQPVRMTDSNPWLADVAMGEQRVVTFTARDGVFDIDGLLILPVGYDEGTAVPLITVVHGGPEAHYSNGWLTAYQLPGQMAAGTGYAVFYPNYRGSTGRGLAFIMSSQADAAGKEFDDIVDGVDYLIAQGIADAERVGVTGGSYGGYATAWMSTYYSERFAAGVMNVGISNNLSKWGTSDIPHELYLVHSREWIWDNNNWQKYLERSPIYHVDRAQTPLLIMHGADDTRVHPGQSLELYRHIVVRQPEVPVRLIFYPGEGHGNIRSASRYDYTLRMMGWFESYLMGDGRMPSLDLPEPQLEAIGGGF
jgi:dipeptidyl aminopeptidase/acylaminoacyl peptidase